MKEKKLFLLDAMALIYRAYFAMSKNPRINSKGQNTSAIMGFTNALYDVLKNQKPTHIAVAFDSIEPTFRHETYPEYKATRDTMPEDIATSIPYIRDIIEAFNIPVVELQGYEADDIIGTLAKKAEEKQFDVYMMTPDKDFGQLVSDRIKIYKPARMGGSAEVIGKNEVCDKYNINRAEQLIDILALWGDSADNIPGIPGIGEKTASKLIKEFGSVQNLIENTDSLKGKLKENVDKYKEHGLMSLELAKIVTDAPIELNEKSLKLQEPNREKLNDIFDDLEFRTLKERVLGVKAETDKQLKTKSVQTSLFDSSQEEQLNTDIKTIKTVSHKYLVIEEESDRKDLIDLLGKSNNFCFDTETTSLDTLTAEIVGISFCIEPGEAWFLYLPEEKDKALIILNEFKPLFENPKIIKTGQNLKYDIQVLMNYNIDVKGEIFDTMIAHYLLQPELRHNMDFMAERYLNYRTVKIEDLIGKKNKRQLSIRKIDKEILKDYACEDADITLQLAEILLPKLEEEGIKKLYREVEVPLIMVLAEMERTGVYLDTEALKVISSKLADDIKSVEETIYKYAGYTFNISSPKQLGEVLFDRLKIVAKPKKTKTKQYSTGEEVLIKLVHHHPIVPEILEYRQLTKLKSTYIDAFPTLIHPNTGRLHTTYNQAITSTGRLSSNNPNLQNIPIRTERGREIRKAFVACDDDHILIAADYSQIELRIIAHLSGDENMIKAFQSGTDIHTATASGLYNVDIDIVSSEMRRNAKTVNFGIVYGISAFGLSERLNISRAEAADMIDGYFTQYPKVKEFMDKSIERARERGYVETMMGRRRYLRDINSGNSFMRQFAERNAINAPIQGSSADMIKVAMVRIFEEFKKKNLKSKMIMQVHDELIFEVLRSEQKEVEDIVSKEMQQALPLSVPVVVDIKAGKNWLEAH